MHSVYALVDPRDEIVHYIGQSKDTRRRYSEHLALRGRNEGLKQWIRGLLASQVQPELVILEDNLSFQQAIEREARWTIRYARCGHPLTNLERTRTGCPVTSLRY